MASNIGEFKGSKVITLTPDDQPDTKYPFSFGLSKAKLILDNYDDIVQFVKDQDPSYEIDES